MTVLLALCPLVVGTPGLPPPPSEEGTREWIWQRLNEAGGGGVTEAVRVFESATMASSAAARRVEGRVTIGATKTRRVFVFVWTCDELFARAMLH